jgi:CRISPR-associated protein Csh2
MKTFSLKIKKKERKMYNQTNVFNNRCYGLVIVKSENSNFNADFTGNPRRLPDEHGTIYATDKALKYSIRRYWVDQGKDVFVWRSHQENGNVRTRDQRMMQMVEIFSINDKEFSKIIKTLEWFEHNCKTFKKEDIDKIINEEIKQIVVDLTRKFTKLTKADIEKIFNNKIQELKSKITATVFAKCIDTKLFGVTYTGEGTLSLTGPVQISYGVNKYEENTVYINDILSPYPTGEEGTTQSSIGKEIKNMESYYVYDFSINPQNIVTHYNSRDDLKQLMQITENDINSLKEAMKYSVTSLDTTSKKDSENAMLLFITLPEKSQQFLPAMKNLVKIEKNEENKVKIDLSKVKRLIERKFNINDWKENDNQNEKKRIKVELYYNELTTVIEGASDTWAINKNL